MTTEIMEVWSLEVGDQIVISGQVYKIVEIEDGDSYEYRLVMVDEEGYRRHIEAPGDGRLRLVIDNLAEV